MTKQKDHSGVGRSLMENTWPPRQLRLEVINGFWPFTDSIAEPGNTRYAVVPPATDNRH